MPLGTTMLLMVCYSVPTAQYGFNLGTLSPKTLLFHCYSHEIETLSYHEGCRKKEQQPTMYCVS